MLSFPPFCVRICFPFVGAAAPGAPGNVGDDATETDPAIVWWTLAHALGDLHDKHYRRLVKALDDADHSYAELGRRAITELANRNLIDGFEAERLSHILDELERDGRRREERVARLAREIIDHGATPLATGLANIAASSAPKPGKTALADVAGGAVGGIGGAGLGPLGALAGAFAFAIVLSAVSEIEE